MDDVTALDLCVPPQRKPSRDSFDYRPKALEAWLNNLPIANIGETSRALFDALTEVNQLQIKPAARLQFLDMIEGKIGYAIAGLRKHYPPREFPLPQKNRKVAELALALLREVVTGYHVIIQSALIGDARLPKKLLAQAVQRAMRASGRLIVEIYSIYEPTPGNVWRVLHKLYQLAERQQVQALPVQDPTLQHAKSATVNDSYKQVLLLAAAGPYRMRNNEAADIYRILERLAPRSELIALTDPRAQEATFQVDLGSDLPPLLNEHPAAGADVRALFTGGLLRAAEAQLNYRRPWWRFWEKRTQAEDPELLRRLVISLGAIPKRQFSRQPLTSRAEVVVGLANISRALAERQGLQNQLQVEDAGAQFVGREMKINEKQGKSDVWELIFPAELARKQAEEEQNKAAKLGGGAKSASAQHDTQRWRMLNISAGGYCLLSDPTQSARAQVGEIMALKDASAPHETWQIGVIRWMKHMPAEGLQLGVQVLGPQPMPLLCCPEQADGSYGQPVRALLLPENIATDQPVTLITPCLHFAEQRKAMLKGMGSDAEVRLTRTLEMTGGFAQFEFRSAAKSSDKEGFEQVFSSL